jgi:hypothetical protein
MRLPQSPIWHGLCKALRLEARPARQLWEVLATSRNPQCQAAVYALCKPSWRHAHTPADVEVLLLHGPCMPQKLMQCCEVLVHTGLMPRRIMAEVEEALLARTTKTGRWE